MFHNVFLTYAHIHSIFWKCLVQQYKYVSVYMHTPTRVCVNMCLRARLIMCLHGLNFIRV